MHSTVDQLEIESGVKRLLKLFLPDYQVNSIYELDPDDFRSRGIKGVITDLDNTLVGAKDKLATPELVRWLKRLQTAGFGVVIVSNNRRARVSSFAEPLNIPYIYSARKPTARAFRRALAILGLKPSETLMIGDQMLTDVFGANRMGMLTLLVQPIAPKDEGILTRINRWLEKLVIRRLKQQGRPWEESKR
jgi:hypothetical protein